MRSETETSAASCANASRHQRSAGAQACSAEAWPPPPGNAGRLSSMEQKRSEQW